MDTAKERVEWEGRKGKVKKKGKRSDTDNSVENEMDYFYDVSQTSQWARSGEGDSRENEMIRDI